MRCDVEWDEAALDELADVYNRSTDKNAITQAANQIDQQLSVDPDQKGQDFYADRLLGVGPLFVVYRVDEDAHIVRVLSVYRV
jgi:hypothetical protein